MSLESSLESRVESREELWVEALIDQKYQNMTTTAMKASKWFEIKVQCCGVMIPAINGA